MIEIGARLVCIATAFVLAFTESFRIARAQVRAQIAIDRNPLMRARRFAGLEI